MDKKIQRGNGFNRLLLLTDAKLLKQLRRGFGGSFLSPRLKPGANLYVNAV